LQNLPRGSKLRTALQAPTGHLLYVADLSNIEARMLAWLAQQEDLLMSFQAGKDVYSEFASSIYNRPISKKDKLERYVGKTAILGLGYGMGSNKFKLTLETGNPPVTITDNTAAQIVNHYRCTYPNIPILWNGCKQMLFGMLGSILEIDKLEDVNIVLQVHDEIIAVSKNTNPNETMDKILSIMKTPPSWCSNLPLDAEGAFSEVYNK
jgi:DNA polymerase I-like protein with 3'-5' exonuclease and polymerase domains